MERQKYVWFLKHSPFVSVSGWLGCSNKQKKFLIAPQCSQCFGTYGCCCGCILVRGSHGHGKHICWKYQDIFGPVKVI